jgi:hypothetical protein
MGSDPTGALCLLVGTDRSLQYDKQVYVAFGPGISTGLRAKQDQAPEARAVDLSQRAGGPAERVPQIARNG